MKKGMPGLIAALLALVLLPTCKKEELDPTPTPNPTLVTVKFEADGSILENSETTAITLSFDKAAPRAGSLTIDVTTATPDAFQTAPAAVNGVLTLPVAKGDASASFEITPVNNNLLDEARTITFELTAVTEGFLIGTKEELVLSILDDEAPAAVSFSAAAGSVLENEAAGMTVSLRLSNAAPEAGKVIIQVANLPEEPGFTTIPAFDNNGRLELAIPAGADSVAFQLKPTDNALLKGHQTLEFSIAETAGAITKGTQLSFEATVLDDELVGKPKTFESGGGNWRSKNTYEYDDNGRVNKVHWETETPFLRQGTKTYYYGANGLIERINHHAFEDEYFYTENGRIVRSEKIRDGLMVSYSLYDYDPAGNLGAQALYHRNATTGEYVQSYIFVYLYFDNGNIYKQLTYLPDKEGEEPELQSTRTYDNYTDSPNPFPMIEIIPGIVAQRHLPGSFRLEENGADLQYNFGYEFNAEGVLIRRTATGGTSELTTYEYY